MKVPAGSAIAIDVTPLARGGMRILLSTLPGPAQTESATVPKAQAIPGSASARDWLDALTNGQIEGLQASTALSTTWHSAYLAWCRSRRMDALCLTHFVRSLNAAGVRSRKWRYRLDGRTGHPRAFLIFDRDQGMANPPVALLGAMEAETRASVDRYASQTP